MDKRTNGQRGYFFNLHRKFDGFGVVNVHGGFLGIIIKTCELFISKVTFQEVNYILELIVCLRENK